MNPTEHATGQARKGTLVRSGRPPGRTSAPVKLKAYIDRYGPQWADSLAAAALSGNVEAIGAMCIISAIQHQQGKS
jgi:hypothetical protein